MHEQQVCIVELACVFSGGAGHVTQDALAREQPLRIEPAKNAAGDIANARHTKNLSINNFPISLPESDEGSSQMRESQVS